MNGMMKSKGFKIAALGVSFLAVALLSFAVGIKVGAKKALFSSRWGENYEKNFMRSGSRQGDGPFGGMMHDFEGRDFRNAHGLAGSIISISGDKLVIKDDEGKENTVTVTDKTIIKSRGSDLKLADLKTGEKIVVLGKPATDGTISADLIRVFNVLPPSGSQQSQNVQSDSSSPVSNNNQ